MTIDVKEPRSDGWWMLRLARKLERRQARLARLHAYYVGDPPLPTGAENAREAYKAFQRKARLNVAELSVEAVRDRMTPIGLQTAVNGDETGDAEAWRLWRATGMGVKVADVLENMLALGDGYMIAGLDEKDGLVVTAEDPRQVVTEHDPRDQRRTLAGLKMFHDDVEDMDFAYLYVPGGVRVARQPRKAQASRGPRFSPASWEWDDDLSGDFPSGLDDVMTVVRFRNKRGIAEFETHMDVCDRINHMLLQRMVIAVMQAFRQRAVKGDLPTVYPAGHPRAGEEIDYEGLFVADPGALWLIPGAADIWESAQADISPLLAAVRDDILHFAAVTRTPAAMLNPDLANQTAEGATFAREGLVFKVEDRIERASEALIDVASLMFRLTGDTERARRDRINVLWAPAERRSLAEKADAASKAAADLPLRARLITIWQLTPAEADRIIEAMASEAQPADKPAA